MKKYLALVLFLFFIKSLSAQTINYTYDNLGRLMQVTYPDSSAIKYTYDAAGNRNTIKTNDLHYHHPQTITFNPLKSVIYGSPDFLPGATVSSGLQISYTSSNPNVASIINGSIHIMGVGTSAITASQVGNNTYSAASNVTDTLSVTPATLTVTANDTNKIVGALNPLLTIKYVGFVNSDDASKLIIKPNVTTTAITNSPVGTYPITVSGASSSNYSFKYIPGTLTIKPIPAPTIISFSPNSAMPGTAVTITGAYFTGATAVGFGNAAAASFTVVSPTSITAVVGTGASGSLSVTTPSGTGTLAGFNFVYDLPPSNFELTITSATCRGSSDGAVNITAAESLNYTATITGNGINATYPFTSSQNISNLAAGAYSICITVAGQPAYQQCYNVVITQPVDLSVYATVNTSNNSVSLSLAGATLYNVTLNGLLYTTTNNSITLPLGPGDNDLLIITDRLCQGTIEKHINISSDVVPYPDPFQSTISLNLGIGVMKNVSIKVYNLSYSKVYFTKYYSNQSGVLQIDLSHLENGVYAIKLTSDNGEKIFKILKQ